MNFWRAGAYIFVLFVFFAVPAYAQDHYPVGKVIAIQGKASLAGGVELRPNDSIFMYSVVKTGADSRLVLLLIDDTEISLGSNSEMEINEFVFDPYDASENKASFAFARGVFQFVSGMITKRDDPNVKLETPYGSIGIRGTVVWGGDINERYGVYIDQGKVMYYLPDTDVFLPAGTGVLINPATKKPSATNAWSPERLELARKSLAFRDQRELKLLIEQEMVRNIERRHEYRKIMWPYKKMPHIPPGDPNAFPYSDEFIQQEQLHRERIFKHNNRMRDWQ